MTQYATKTLENILNNIKSARLTKAYFMMGCYDILYLINLEKWRSLFATTGSVVLPWMHSDGVGCAEKV